MKHIFFSILFISISFQTSFAIDSVLNLNDDRLAMECKIDLMLQAQTSISMSYYAINEDEVGLKYAAAACYKAKQGLKVKIIIERSRSKVTKDLVQLFRDYGINIKYYNSFRAQKVQKNFSWLHNKLLVADADYVVLGGRNLNDKYYPNSEQKTELTDFETLIKGKSGADAHVYIDHLMNSRFGDKPKIKKKDIDTTSYKHLDSIIQHHFVNFKNHVPKNWDSLLYAVKDVEFIHDNYDHWPKSKHISDSILYTLRRAKKNIVIVSPYLIPPLRFMKALKKAAKHNVAVTLISNSPQLSDAKIIAAAYMNDRRKYLKRGIKVFEYNGEKMMHDKLFLIDDSISIVGSCNFDNISFRMNSEVIAKINDVDFGALLKVHVDQRIMNCFKVESVRSKNPYNNHKIRRRTTWNRILLRIFPFIKRFL